MTEEDQAERKARAVRDMFASIAPRYDFLNHFLSANIDRRWRRTCADEVRKSVADGRPRILDVGCGTGDLSIEFSRLGPVTGCDFCHPMLQIGRGKVSGSSVHLVAGDALVLPFQDAAFDVVVSAFVLRNLGDLDKGLREMRRVLRPGGTLAALEFAIPRVPVLGALYRFYFLRILPLLGNAVSGVAGAYRYLPDSVQRFPPPEQLKRIMVASGFSQVRCKPLSAGIAILYVSR